MTNLLHAYMRRVLKTRAFRIAVLFQAGLAVFQVLTLYMDYRKGLGTPYFDDALCSTAAIGVFPLAAFAALFIGTEFQEGTIRNQLTVGKGRAEIYMAQFLTELCVGWLLIAAWTAAYLIPGVILLKNGNPPIVYLIVFAGIMVEFAAFAAIFTAVSMLLANKASSAVACILLTLVMLMCGIVTNSMLEEPEYYSPSVVVTADGEVTAAGEPEPNPNYLPEGSDKRLRCEFLSKCSPGGQAVKYAAIQLEDTVPMVLYDLGWIVVMTGIGAFAFRRKDLK